MKSILILTSEKLTMNNCIDSFKKIRKNIDVNEKGISFGKAPNSLYLWFSEEKAFTSTIEMPLDNKYKEIVKIADPYCSTIDYHKISIVKELIKELINVFEDMYILVDENDEWVGTASDFLNKEFDF